LVKPNITAPYPPSSGITSDICVVEAVIHVLKDIGVKDIVID